MASEQLMGGHGRGGAISSAWSWNTYAWETVLTITQKVWNLCRGCVWYKSAPSYLLGGPKKSFVFLFWTEPLQSQRRNTRRNSWRHSSWETNSVRKRHLNCRSCWREWVSYAKLTEMTSQNLQAIQARADSHWEVLSTHCLIESQIILTPSSPIQASWLQTVMRETPWPKSTAFHKVCFCFLGPGKISRSQNLAKINIRSEVYSY